MREQIINWLIKITKADTNKISDGYHTFEELYEHRIWLWIVFCEQQEWGKVWRSRRHSDGSKWEGWFILGYEKKSGHQITYHLPEKYYAHTKFAETLDKAPEWDGHTPYDVVERLKYL